MTVRHSLRAQLIAQVVHTPELFGAFVTHESAAPAIDIASVHHLYKRVNGRPLQRPAWYYDTTVQGDGVVDVQSHMVEQAQWWVLGDAEGDVRGISSWIVPGAGRRPCHWRCFTRAPGWPHILRRCSPPSVTACCSTPATARYAIDSAASACAKRPSGGSESLKGGAISTG